MTHLPVVYADPEDIVDPETVPGLRYNRTTWWYDAPTGLLPCPLCGKPQRWHIPIDRRLRVRPNPSPQPTAPEDAPTPTALQIAASSASADPPPGFTYVECGYCLSDLVLYLRPLAGLPAPPALVEINTIMLNYSAVQYRLADDINTKKPRWRTALVTTQHDGTKLDLSVLLHPSDPEHRQLVDANAQHCEYRISDSPSGEPRWRLAMIADRLDDGLDLTVHYSKVDQAVTGRAFDRKRAVEGDEVGCWRHSQVNVQTTLSIRRADRGATVGCWLPTSS